MESKARKYLRKTGPYARSKGVTKRIGTKKRTKVKGKRKRTFNVSGKKRQFSKKQYGHEQSVDARTEAERILDLGKTDAEIGRQSYLLPRLKPVSLYIRMTNQDEEKKRRTAYEITNANDSGYQSLNDPRGGAKERDTPCGTCRKSSAECPGHEGYINLETMVYHPVYVREIIKVLNSVCQSCGTLFLSDADIEDRGIMGLPPRDRLTLIEKLSEGSKCCAKKVRTTVSETGEKREIPICECAQNPKYDKPSGNEIKSIRIKSNDKKSDRSYEVPIEEVYRTLDSISPETAKILGFGGASGIHNDPLQTHPRDMIIRSLTVMAPCLRMEYSAGSQRWSDPMAKQYRKIIRINSEIAEHKSGKKKYQDPRIIKDKHGASSIRSKPKKKPKTLDQKKGELIKAVQNLIVTQQQSKSGGGNDKDSIKRILDSKRGRVRSAAIGKRVNFSARSVLSPGINLSFGEIGIPRAMSYILTVKEKVTLSNYKWIQLLWSEGKISHKIASKGPLFGRRVNIEYKNFKKRGGELGKLDKRWKIDVGDIVSRNMVDGDYIIFNRQPTLHKGSIMGYRVRLHDDLTIKVHLASTTPHNADYDGDEGTLHMVQTNCGYGGSSDNYVCCLQHNVRSEQQSYGRCYIRCTYVCVSPHSGRNKIE